MRCSFFDQMMLSLGIIAILTGCEAVHSHHPDIANGGRVNALAAHPRDDKTCIAAAETGGLFKTTDAGKTWTHISSLPEFAMNDVKYALSETNVLLATCLVDTRTVNGGGIWRSTDNGKTWDIPPTSVPPALGRYTTRNSAYCISFEPGSTKVIVGTDGGVAISNDLGGTWKHVLPEPLRGVYEDSTQDRIYSVICRGEGQMNAAGPGGIYYSEDAGNTWKKSATGPWGVGSGFHRFAISPYNNRHLFLTTDNRVYRPNPADNKNPFPSYATYVSTDGGVNWNSINVPEEGFVRPSFIKTSLALNGAANQFELYYGSGYGVHRKTCTHTSSGPDLGGNWIPLNADHSDPSDLAFTTDKRYPTILATDGGIHKTEDQGQNWKMAGGGKNGLNALQITEVTGHMVAFRSYQDKEANFHTDLYFGTQDNHVWASPDAGETWTNKTGGEGFYVQPEGRKILSAEEARVLYVTCTGCDNKFSGAYFANEKSWTNPNNKLEGNPFYLHKPGHYVQNSLKALSPTESINNFQVTYSYGSTWTPRVDIPYGLWGYPHVVPSSTGPVVYQAIPLPGERPSKNVRIGLIKIKNIESGTPVIYRADGTGFGSLGIFATMFAWYIVYAVNPANPNHVIMADVENKQMKYTLNGGRCWYTDDALTKLVTDNGNLRFEDNPFLMQVHSIAFDPDDPRRIAVGTQQAGIICSLNGGASWEKIEKTEKITHISSFFFGLDNKLYVSSYGRGLWKINLEKGNSKLKLNPEPRCVAIWFKDKSAAKTIAFDDLSDIPGCRGCSMYTAKDAAITNVVTDQDGKIKSIAVSAGQLVSYDSLLQELPATEIPYQVVAGMGDFSKDSTALSILRQKETIRGVVVQNGYLKGYVYSQQPFPSYSQVLMKPPGNEPRINLRSKQIFAGLPGLQVMDTLFVSGFHFDPDKNRPVLLLTGNDTLAVINNIDPAGNFFNAITVSKLRPGFHALRAIQRADNKPAIVAIANFSISLSDKAAESPLK